MTGVEILSTNEIYNTIIPMYWGLVGFILMFVSIICGAIAVVELENVKAIIYGILLICGVTLSIIGLAPSDTNIDYIKYKVTISDEVSMNEFYEKYEVLDQEGKIYTVRERE